MKLLHISDLHIGKKVKGFSLLEDQQYVLSQILSTVKEYEVDGIIIAGDIYDNSTPSSEAVSCFDWFVSQIHSLSVSCYVVSGNHDSIYRVSFGSDIMAEENVYFAKKYSGKIEPIKAKDGVNIWLLPFIRPYDVREYHPDFEIGSYEDMMKTVISNLEIDESQTNLLVAHQFITTSGKEPERSESETISLGTLDNIDYSNFDKFDYVALGHIHKPQAMGRKTVRYAGSILKYSFDEKDHIKSMVLIDIKDKKADFELLPLKPLKDMKEFTGKFDELMKLPSTDDYVRIVLKDENFITDVKHKLETNFKNIMEIVYDNKYTRENREIDRADCVENKTPLELFQKFYFLQHNSEMNEEEIETVRKVFEELEEIE